MAWILGSFGLLIICISLCFYIIYQRSRWKKNSENETRIFQLVESSKDIVYYYQVKPERKFLYLSPAIEKFLGKGTLAETYHNPDVPYERIHPDDFDIFSKKIEGVLDYSQVIIQRWQDDKGEYRWFEEYATPIYEDGKYVAIQGIIRNIDETAKLKMNLEYRITHDALTNIYNRSFFEQNMEKYNQLIDSSVAIILFDLDNLKYMNDHYGHKQGDELIKETAKLLNQFFPTNSIVSRIGGDEFAVILINSNSMEAEYLIKNLSEEINKYNKLSRGITINMSAGYAYHEHSIGKMEDLLSEADKNMYQNKRTRKDRKLFMLIQ